MCKKSQISNSVSQQQLQIQSGLQKQILFESFDPVDVSFPAGFFTSRVI